MPSGLKTDTRKLAVSVMYSCPFETVMLLGKKMAPATSVEAPGRHVAVHTSVLPGPTSFGERALQSSRPCSTATIRWLTIQYEHSEPTAAILTPAVIWPAPVPLVPATQPGSAVVQTSVPIPPTFLPNERWNAPVVLSRTVIRLFSRVEDEEFIPDDGRWPPTSTPGGGSRGRAKRCAVGRADVHAGPPDVLPQRTAIGRGRGEHDDPPPEAVRHECLPLEMATDPAKPMVLNPPVSAPAVHHVVHTSTPLPPTPVPKARTNLLVLASNTDTRLFTSSATNTWLPRSPYPRGR